MRLAVVGVGALGAEVARLLALCGAGELVLVDPDRLETSNLTRSALCGEADIGRFKAEALAQRIGERCPDVRITAVNREIADTGWGALAGCNVLFVCVDRDSARLEAARIATRLDLPMCDGGLGGVTAESGRVSLFGGAAAACFCCRLTADRRRELLREWHSQPHPCGAPEAAEVRASTPLIASLVAAHQVDGGLRALPGGESSSIDVRLGALPELHRFQLVRSAGCPFHTTRRRWFAVETTFAEALRQHSAVGWEWPLCTRAKCRTCGREWRPLERVSRLRLRGVCPACGAGGILPVEAIREIRPGSEWEHARPAEIGLPDDHRYTNWDLP